MEKFVVTFVDGTQCVCYRNPEQGSPLPLVTVLLSNSLLLTDPIRQLPVPRRLRLMGVANHDTDMGPLSVSHLPRCYLNTEPGRDRLRLLAALALGRYCRQLLEN